MQRNLDETIMNDNIAHLDIADLPPLPKTQTDALKSSASSSIKHTQRLARMLDFPNVYIFEPQLSAEKLKTVDKGVFLSNEFAKSDSSKEIQLILLACGSKHVDILHPSLENYKVIIAQLASQCASGESMCVFNLCDGTVSICRELETARIPFTGADSAFFLATTSKPYLKQLLQKANVATSVFHEIRAGNEECDVIFAETLLTYPMIVKPAVSYASLSITNSSVVHTRQQAIAQAQAIQSENPDGIFIEAFLPGREFTVLCTGDSNHPDGVVVFPAAERVFNAKLTQFEKLLAFDRYWEGFEMGAAAPEMDSSAFYWYELAPTQWQLQIEDLAKRAYISQGGCGYGRVDMRTQSIDSVDGLCVLEVNANCGLSFIPGSSTTAEILRMSKTSPIEFLSSIVWYAVDKQQ